jgi:GxxExxY protein
MHPLYDTASRLTGEIIAAAIEVHKTMGPGLIESIYEWCLTKELELRGFHVSNQQIVTVRYKSFSREEPLRLDLLVEQCVLVEVKATEDIHPIHKAKLLSYMKMMDIPIGLMINFHVEKLTDGVSRMILAGASHLFGDFTGGRKGRRASTENPLLRVLCALL